MKADREKALVTKYGRIQENLERHSRQLRLLPVGAVVQVQNQRGKDPLRWDKSGIVVESLGNQQYTVKMDGSGRVSLRNRKFLRKIEPFVPRYNIMENAPAVRGGIVDQGATTGGGEGDVPSDVTDDQVVGVNVEEETLRRSTRSRRAPDRLEANLISLRGRGR